MTNLGVVQHHFKPPEVEPVTMFIIEGQVAILVLSLETERVKLSPWIEQNARRCLQRDGYS